LKTHPEDLYFYLRQIMSILKSKGIPINWSQLLRDIGYWDHPNRFVQRRWAASFWGNAGSSQETTQL
ncbi:MAG: type I-E CRISPR-associated protein Cse2/CasB, partial [Chloroflexota bacterium]